MFDLIVIGGGPGGYVCAIRAAQLGGRVALVEEGALGGTCLNRGCIPTKALLESARRYSEIREAAQFGINVSGVTLDFAKVVARQRQVVSALRNGVGGLLSSNGVEVKNGRGNLAGPGKVSVTAPDGKVEVLESKAIVLATGSVPAMPPIPGSNLPGVLNSDSALSLEVLPASMVIIGGGVIGMEFASYLSAFGVAVTVLEMLPAILPGQDGEVVAEAAKLLKRKKIAIETGVKVKEIKPGLVVAAELPSGEVREFPAEQVLIATGRRPSLGGIDAAAHGIALNGRAVKVDEYLRTTAPGVFAIGDVTGSALAHAASSQGLVAAEAAMGQGHRPYDGRLMPGVIFTDPEIASIGLTEAAARATDKRVVTAKFPLSAIGKALASGHKDGFVKIVAEEEYGEILGVHVIGAHASDLIHEGVVALNLECTVDELAHMIHAHPTMSEAIMEAVHGLVGGFVHLPRPKK
ncbi:MAG TPA: dihydrolipoyl dehydrogenase [Symbiobacteriaceae bacterium]|jgi:dihydrolipoamide dehydrogenase